MLLCMLTTNVSWMNVICWIIVYVHSNVVYGFDHDLEWNDVHIVDSTQLGSLCIVCTLVHSICTLLGT